LPESFEEEEDELELELPDEEEDEDEEEFDELLSSLSSDVSTPPAAQKRLMVAVGGSDDV